MTATDHTFWCHECEALNARYSAPGQVECTICHAVRNMVYGERRVIRETDNFQKFMRDRKLGMKFY